MADECCNCKTKLKPNFVKCAGVCKKCYHPECVNMTNDEVKWINKVKNIKWFCDNCLSYFENNNNMKLELDEFKNDVSKKFENIQNMLSTSNELYRSKNLQKNKSYAEVVAGEVVVIKPKKIQENKTTKEAIGFTEIKDIRDGGMLIKCKSKEDVEKIKSEAEKKLKKRIRNKNKRTEKSSHKNCGFRR
ncbi:hypothetical protein NQ318_011142 [Aromia moschata]|uniref:PHD-type domain-containing protein n=1 Tax=Aromia moschata TaxID=1265417 RepID=A0AAV8X2W8_9CUCU|nr:hypothetical protein NQ318_011142 [Aromia moschata]